MCNHVHEDERVEALRERLKAAEAMVAELQETVAQQAVLLHIAGIEPTGVRVPEPTGEASDG